MVICYLLHDLRFSMFCFKMFCLITVWYNNGCWRPRENVTYSRCDVTSHYKVTDATAKDAKLKKMVNPFFAIMFFAISFSWFDTHYSKPIPLFTWNNKANSDRLKSYQVDSLIVVQKCLIWDCEITFCYDFSQYIFIPSNLFIVIRFQLMTSFIWRTSIINPYVHCLKSII